MRLANIAVTLCLAVAAVGPALAQSGGFFSEVVEVRVTNVDVVVTGRDGKPVTGLTRDDFEVYENGVRQEITNFLEVRGSAAMEAPQPGTAGAAPIEDMRRRDITVFVDDAVLHPFRRNAILGALRRFLEETVRGGDTVAIAVWSQSLKLALEPTSDRAAIAAALDALARNATFASSEEREREEFHRAINLLIRAFQELDPPQKPPWFSAISEARSYAMRRTHALRQRVEALKTVVAWRRGVDGRKIVVLLTEELPLNPVDDVFLHLDAIRDQFAGANTMALSEAREFAVPGLIEEIAETANSAGVTLYPIDGAGKDRGVAIGDASQSARFTPTGRVDAPLPTGSLRGVAAETGGIALTGSDNWKLAFDTIAADLHTYYSLGYRSTGTREDRLKRVDVKVKDRRQVVRTRRAVIERSIGSEMHDAVAANLFRPSGVNDLTVRASAGSAQAKDEQTVVIPVTITIPMEKLTLLPDGDDLAGKVALYAAFSRRDGAVSKVAQHPGEIRFPAASLKRRKELTVKLDVTTDASTNTISIGVLDEVSRATGFATLSLP